MDDIEVEIDKNGAGHKDKDNVDQKDGNVPVNSSDPAKNNGNYTLNNYNISNFDSVHVEKEHKKLKEEAANLKLSSVNNMVSSTSEQQSVHVHLSGI